MCQSLEKCRLLLPALLPLGLVIPKAKKRDSFRNIILHSGLTIPETIKEVQEAIAENVTSRYGIDIGLNPNLV